MILHCMKRADWDVCKHKASWGEANIEAEGFIHCSTVAYFWRVAPNLIGIEEEQVLLCIDESKLKAEVRYEDGDHCGREYPHVYGVINNDAVEKVLPFLKNADGIYKKNPEFADIEDQ